MVGLTWVAWREIRSASDTFAAALKDAEEANQAKTNFLAVVSHELRNPLNSILLWCNALLTTGTLEGKVDQGVNAIWRAAKAQAQLIEDLLDISRIESGQMRFDVQPTNPAEVVRAAVDSMSPAAEAKSIAIQVVLDPRADVIMGDSQRLAAGGVESPVQRDQVHAQGRQGAGAPRANQFASGNCRRRQRPGDRQART